MFNLFALFDEQVGDYLKTIYEKFKRKIKIK